METTRKKMSRGCEGINDIPEATIVGEAGRYKKLGIVGLGSAS
jgi:hypothetical protein